MERVLDRNLSGGVKRRFDLHLSRCEECRAFIAAEQAEHQRWFKAVNSSEELLHSLPTDFADRLVAAVVARSAMRRPFFMRLPRWALLAASLALMAGFVFASVKLTMGNVEFEEGEGEGPKVLDGAEATAVEISDTAAIDPSASYVASVSPSPSTQLETNQEGITPMSKTKAAIALTLALSAGEPVQAYNSLAPHDNTENTEFWDTRGYNVEPASSSACVCATDLFRLVRTEATSLDIVRPFRRLPAGGICIVVF